MHVLFEEDGAFKTATILTDNDASLQVETASGKRAKIKSANVMLRYLSPAPGELLEQAEALAEGIEQEFLWECAGDGEFSFVILPTTTSATRPPRSRRLRCCLPYIQHPSTSIARAKAASARPLPTFSQLLWPVLKRSVSKR